ncbi:unnamed protein product [Meganyctiphanes norvegica]|uniref:Uncharacterized protein n=1 Tax=Meganyctiphanes norvegica TaxID=48144 RepID=A0AAV2QZH4_MEGNR
MVWRELIIKKKSLENGHYNLRKKHNLQLVKTGDHLNIRRNFFSRRIIDKRNNLNEYEVSAPNTHEFKKRYDKKEIEHQKIINNKIYRRLKNTQFKSPSKFVNFEQI